MFATYTQAVLKIFERISVRIYFDLDFLLLMPIGSGWTYVVQPLYRAVI